MTTTKQRIAERRQRNAELARQDRANRCAVCQRNLLECPAILEDFLIDGKFCSDACLAEARERAR